MKKLQLRTILKQLIGTGKPRTIEDLINEESKIGATIFGPVPTGMERHFFYDNRNGFHEWFFTERPLDGTADTVTLRYQILPNGILKIVNGTAHEFVRGKELEDLLLAMKVYEERVRTGLYQPKTI